MLAGIGYWLIGGLDFSVFLGFLTGFASFVPLAGAAVVWIGAAIYLLVIGEVGRAIGLALWGVVVVSMVDNFIKPLFIGGRAEAPDASCSSSRSSAASRSTASSACSSAP